MSDQLPEQVAARKPPADINLLDEALRGARSPEDVRKVEAGVDMYEAWLRATGLWNMDDMRPVNEMRMRARWKLGRLLAEVERAQGARTDLNTSLSGSTKSFRSLLSELDVDPAVALAAQRIGTLPDGELERVLQERRQGEGLVTFNDLIIAARPYWYQESRKKKHRDIAASAVDKALPIGPFPLIYADPPWQFHIYSEKGAERTPDQHYPTLSDEEIEDLHIGDLSMSEIAHADAALFLWCTSSNLDRALGVLAAWGFRFKASAAWVKDKSGLGLVFRNQHEILLYGTRGKMPGPQYQPPSVFSFPRGAHSAKPPEIRTEIERMYPDFDGRTRLEMFSRETHVDGWSLHGFEAGDRAAA